MKRLSRILFLALLALGLFAFGGIFAGSGPAGTVYAAEGKELKTDSYGGTSFQYPADWQVQDNDDKTIRYYYANPSNFLMLTTTSLGSYNTDGISDEDVTTIMNSFLEGVESSGGVITEKELKETAGCKGFHFLFDETINEKTYACDSYAFMKGTNLYSYSFAYPKDDGNAYADDYAAIIQSITVE